MGKQTGRGRGRGGTFPGYGRGNGRGRGHGRGPTAPRMEIPDLTSLSLTSAAVQRSGRGRGRGHAHRGLGFTRGRGGALAVTSQNRVPFDYNAKHPKVPIPEAVEEQGMEEDEESGVYAHLDNALSPPESDKSSSEDEKDVTIEPHKKDAKSIPHRRKLEGLVLNECQYVVERKAYNFKAMLHHANPLRRPILFVKSSGVYDKESIQPREPTETPPPSIVPTAMERKGKEPVKEVPAPAHDEARKPLTKNKKKKDKVPTQANVPMPDGTDDFLSFRMADQILTKGPRNKPLSEQEAILADWMENAMLEEEESMTPVPLISGIADPFGAHTTLEDIAIDAHDREQKAWESESEEDDDDDDDDELLVFDEDLHALMLNQIGKATEEDEDSEVDDTLFQKILTGTFTRERNGGISEYGRVSKKKSQQTPAFQGSLWAEELQSQWEKDRASKAEKKKRVEARMAAAYDPFPNTHGHVSSKKKSKAQKKQENRQRRAQLRMLANDEEGGMVAFSAPASFAHIREMIESFLQDEGRTTLTLPAMKKHDRAMVHNMADAYQIKSKSRGKGKERFPILYKTSRSGQNVDHARVTRLVRTPFGSVDDEAFEHRGLGRGGRVRIELAPRHREGSQVGGGAKHISEDNIGHQLLRSMGWSMGQGLGHSGGRAEPVLATVKMTRSGLGM